MLDDFHSAYLSRWLKRKINSISYYRYKLRLLANCMTYADASQGVSVISNGQSSRILGPRACNHSWACPECTARVMKNYSARIAAGIDALAENGYSASMLTFTVFHTSMMSCEETFLLLNKAWTLFDKNKTWSRKRKTPLTRKQPMDSTVTDTYKSGGAWSNFYRTFECKHTVKTLETTYGKHGWHPHIHMLIWVKSSDLQKLAEWESKLNEQWASCVDRAAKQILTDEHRYNVRKFLESKETREDALHLGVHISKTEDGKIKRWSSADYLCGWGGENELTGLGLKSARGNNMTPFEMLEKAQQLEQTNITESNRLVELYLAFAWTVIKHRISRIQFSRTGLKAIIDTHLQTERFKEIIKKKKEHANIVPYQNIVWLSKKQWCDICASDNVYLIPLIRHFAKYLDGKDGPCAFDLISELLVAHNIAPPIFKKHPVKDYAKSFNEIIAA